MRSAQDEGQPHGGAGRQTSAKTSEWNHTPPLTDDEVCALGFEPTRRGWVPLTDEVAERIAAADARRTDRSLSFVDGAFRIPGKAECIVCGSEAEASTVGTPTCSAVCASVLMNRLLERIGDELYTMPDGSGGRAPVRPIAPARSPKRPSVALKGSASVERALERLADCRTVLERHGVDVRWGRTARCPLHDDEHPSMSLYERNGRSRAHCFPCDFDGDAIDLEAAISGEDVATTIKRWGSS